MNYSTIIYGYLSSIPAISNIVSAKIYPVTVAQEKIFPTIAFTKRIEPTNTKGQKNCIEDCIVNIYCISDDLDQADTLAQLIRSELDRKSQFEQNTIKISSVTFVGQDFEQYDAELDVFLIPVTYKIRIRYENPNT